MVKVDKYSSSWSLHSNELVEGKTDVNHSDPFIETLMRGSDEWMMHGERKEFEKV